VGVDTNKGSVALRFENFDEFVSFFVEDTDELLKSVEVETWGQDSSPGHPFSSCHIHTFSLQIISPH
jgi:hypothetical protein